MFQVMSQYLPWVMLFVMVVVGYGYSTLTDFVPKIYNGRSSQYIVTYKCMKLSH